MHERTNIQLSAAGRKKLESVIANRNIPQSYKLRATMTLASLWRDQSSGSDGSISWPDQRYCRVGWPGPFKKEAQGILPSGEAVGVDRLPPNANIKLPTVSPAINTPAMASISTPSRRTGS